MNRRTLVGGTAALALAAFAGAAYVFRAQPEAPAPTPDAPALNAGLDPAVLNRPHSPILGPNLDLPWEIAGSAGLDVAKGKVDRMMPGIVATLNIDAADVVTAGVQQTPTFFVNGKPLLDFGPEGLFATVRSEVEAL